MVSFKGQKKLGATPRSVSFRGLIQNFRRASPPVSYAESPPGHYLHAPFENLRVDFSRDSIDALTGHFKNTSENRIFILYRNFIQTAADSRCFEPSLGAWYRLLCPHACGQHRFI